MKDKNHMIISIDIKKTFDKVQCPFMIKNVQQTGNRRSIPQRDKGHMWEIYSQHHTQWTKAKIFPSNISNKTRMSAFTTFIQHSIGSPSNSDLTRKINKIQQIGKEELKVSLFPDNMIVYIENLINSAKKLLDLISEFGKVAGYKVNIQKSMAFLYTTNELSEREIKEQFHLL